MLERIARNWWAVAAQAAALIIFGVVTLFYPFTGIAALVYLFGAFALVEGAFGIMAGYDFRREGQHAALLVGTGVVSMLAGALAFAWPAATFAVLYTVMAVWAIVTGVMRIMSAVSYGLGRPDARLLLISGVLSAAFGLILALKPGIGLLAVSMLIGIYAVSTGVALAMASLWLRDAAEGRLTITMAPTSATAPHEMERRL